MPHLRHRVVELSVRLAEQLVPADPHHRDNTILEVRAEGEDRESALFAGDLVGLYRRYSERRGWTVKLLEQGSGDLGGYRDSSRYVAVGPSFPGSTS
ncbi:PCRF domain-containing protein [Nocardia acididurans]|uniref:PCRF domain-containing protein n=1 Tax=Nocardia acididurans TaxID=2802282 RepID=UPI003555CD0E